nr:reverse transcriptase domain-containing protein [Tanacetum cinerariifolium]
MADTRTMSELLQAPTEGYKYAIVIPAILAENFELIVGLLSLTTNLKNDITNFLQRFNETFSEAWDRFKVLLRKCPHYGFSELHQINTFYNALTQSDQDSLNAAAGENLLNRTSRDALMIIENKSEYMRARSSSNLIVESFTILKRHNRRRSKQIAEPEIQTIIETLIANMADTRTMSELLQAPTEGYKYAIVIPAILAENFELKVGLLSLVTSSQFHGFEWDDPHSYICWFNKITSTLKYKNVPHDAIKLMLFPFSLKGAARTWLEKEPTRLIHT